VGQIQGAGRVSFPLPMTPKVAQAQAQVKRIAINGK
jgi:hypothetical protein